MISDHHASKPAIGSPDLAALARAARAAEAEWIQAAQHLQAAAERRDQTRAARDDGIRHALATGQKKVTDIMLETGLSRSRVYQIRDGRR